MMTKRPASSPSSPPKRQELSSSLLARTEDSQVLAHHVALKSVIDSIKDGLRLPGKGIGEPSFEPNAVYWRVRFAPPELGKRSDFCGENGFAENYKEQRHDFLEALRRGVANGASLTDMEAVVSHSVFEERSLRTFETELPSESIPRESQERVIEDSWTADFRGESPLMGLKSHVANQLSSHPQAYGRYCSIIQSSGMGKSRLLDEMSKKFFLIPINLRSAESRGYPPPDHQVRNFLHANGERLERGKANILVRHFLLALFEKTEDVLRTNMDMGHSKMERISNFRKWMSKDQSMKMTGKDRRSFYDEVLERAHKAMTGHTPNEKELSAAFDALNQALNAGSDETANRIYALENPAFVDVFIVFDEAHTLTGSYDDDKESRFVSLRRVLHSMCSLPLFSFFLSTTGKVTQFGQPRGHDVSDRINGGCLVSPRPYVFVGFDQLTEGHKFREGQSVRYVTSLSFIAHLGRPLWGSRYDHGGDEIHKSLLDFAVQKLLCTHITSVSQFTWAQKYAILSQRLALDINTPRYLTPLSDCPRLEGPVQPMQVLHEQVANHMRVCVAVGEGIETLYAVASSEPILSEAASHIMRTAKFSMSGALTQVLTGFCIDQGQRGELLVAALFTCARDLVVHSKPLLPRDRLCHYFSVNDLLSTLFSESALKTVLAAMPSLSHSGATKLPFGEVFGKAYMHFNHFIKPQEQRLLSRGYLLLYLARGAAALGANCQPGFDAVYPFLYNCEDLVRKQVGFIIVQVKNDSNTYRSRRDIFPNMDPLKCGLLDESDLEDGIFPIPVIRLFFELSKNKSDVIHNQYNSVLEGATSETQDKCAHFTSYDFVCQGVSPKVFRPVEESPEVWAALVNKSPWASLYQVSVPDIVRAQLPGCGSNGGHWTPWVEEFSKIVQT